MKLRHIRVLIDVVYNHPERAASFHMNCLRDLANNPIQMDIALPRVPGEQRLIEVIPYGLVLREALLDFIPVINENNNK